MNFAQQQFLWALLVVLPAVAGLFYWSWRVKQKLMRQFIGSRLLGALTVGFSPERHWLRLALFGAAIVGIMLALARPQRGYIWEEAKTMGLDIIVAIDTSRSMLAQDVVPNRLEKSKLAVYDLMRQSKTDRLGLIVFAGTAFLQSPLTLDDQAFRQGLDAVNVGIIPQGGTALSAAIRAAIAAFEKNNDNHKVLVMFTDGEDHDADTETLAAAKEAAEAGIHIYTVGVGTPAGELLRVRDDQGNWGFVKDESGNVVKSHLNQTLLQQIATDAQGFYLPLQGANPMDTLYQRGPGKLPKSEGTTRQTKVPLERFHWPLGFAIVCLILEFVIPESPRRSRRSESSASSSKTVQRAAATVCLLLAGISLRASPTEAYHDYQSGNFKAAAEEYNRLSQVNSNDYRLNYDAGAAAYRAKQFELAEKQFNAALTSPSVTPDVQAQEKTYYNLGNTEYQLGASLDPEKKQDRWQQAIDNYTQALQLAKQLNTNDVEAQNNLSYVQRKLEELKQQQQQQQKQDKKQNKDQKQDKDQKDQQDGQNKDQKDQQNKQDQQQQKNGKQDQKNSQDKKQDEQKKRQQEQAKKDKEKQKQEQQKSAGKDKKDQKDQPEDQQPQEAQGQPGQMTPEEARQILASQKDDEKALIFQPTNAPVSTQSGKIKDW